LSKKVIILGSSGYLGENIARFLKQNNFNVIGISRKKSSFTTLQISDYFSDYNEITKQISKNDILINCINDQKCEKNKVSFINFFLEKINFSIKILQISSLSVYNEINNEYLKDEKSTLNPMTSYGKLKLSIENNIKNNTLITDYLILRVGGVFGKKRLPILIRLKRNIFTYSILKIFFSTTYLKLLSINKLNYKILSLLEKDDFNRETINLFYNHLFIVSKNNFFKKFIKRNFLRSYYIIVSNNKI